MKDAVSGFDIPYRLRLSLARALSRTHEANLYLQASLYAMSIVLPLASEMADARSKEQQSRPEPDPGPLGTVGSFEAKTYDSSSDVADVAQPARSTQRVGGGGRTARTQPLLGDYTHGPISHPYSHKKKQAGRCFDYSRRATSSG